MISDYNELDVFSHIARAVCFSCSSSRGTLMSASCGGSMQEHVTRHNSSSSLTACSGVLQYTVGIGGLHVWSSVVSGRWTVTSSP